MHCQLYPGFEPGAVPVCGCFTEATALCGNDAAVYSFARHAISGLFYWRIFADVFPCLDHGNFVCIVKPDYPVHGQFKEANFYAVMVVLGRKLCLDSL